MKYSSKPIRKEVVPNQIQKKIIASIGPQELNKMMKKKDFFLLDIYYPEQKHIIGTDRYIPFDQIVTRSKDLPKDKSKKIIIYCKNGSLGKIAAEEISKMGYIEVYYLEGGLDKWKKLGYRI